MCNRVNLYRENTETFMRRTDHQIALFREWLVQCGATVEPGFTPWEILRFRSCRTSGVTSVYRNTKGKESWDTIATTLYAEYAAGKRPRLAHEDSVRYRTKALVAALVLRDGLECWFCGKEWPDQDSPDLTIEHLLSRNHGGPNHESNLTIACERCNAAAGSLPIVGKVMLRERLRAERKIECVGE